MTKHATAPYGQGWPPYRGPMEPVYPCRNMPTRHCPAGLFATCAERPCARYESTDETPWLPEMIADRLRFPERFPR